MRKYQDVGKDVDDLSRGCDCSFNNERQRALIEFAVGITNRQFMSPEVP
jgi:hypothetical protein